ncbi:hypothetical protein [Lentilactobacillus diolivorans]|uniref:Uncharacterized protein n=1 Tax=Lentilactobacillus diolivorans TaxID=179838 RepID=A0ABQ0XAU3_9LACO|nr:hypothetical protein [Lentilactobacillus diolivorans]GEP23188.1 hypothetical protein LDI01_07810 [Lentilactobacillus diolivorans]
MKSLLKISVATLLSLAALSTPNFGGIAVSANTRSISLKESIHILKRNGYGSEVSLPKLKARTSKRTLIWTYPGAQGMDKISLRPIGKHYVKIHAIFGTLHGGHFHVLHYPYAPHYKTVKR